MLLTLKPLIIDVGWILFLTKSFALCTNMWPCQRLWNLIEVRLRHGCNYRHELRRTLSNSAAIITTEVVPSPTSLSWSSANSTSTYKRYIYMGMTKTSSKNKRKTCYLIFGTLAAGCSTSNNFRMVAPSLVIVTSPISSTNIYINITVSSPRKNMRAKHPPRKCRRSTRHTLLLVLQLLIDITIWGIQCNGWHFKLSATEPCVKHCIT